MAKKVSGFLADDGAWFPTREEARYHEAKIALSILCESHEPPRKPDILFDTLEAWAEPILEYVNAYKDLPQSPKRQTIKDTPQPSSDQEDDGD